MKNLSIKIFAIIILLTIAVFSQNTNPVVSAVDFSISGTTVTVNYKVADAKQSTVKVQMEVSSNGGTTWDFNYGEATGHIGEGIATGTDLKTITWTYSGDPNNNFKIRIIADDLVGDQIYYAGKVYNTVTIGSQIWLRENLDVGTMINSTTSGYQQTNNGIIEKYCYENKPSNCNTDGGLYEWPEAMQYVTSEGARGICPEGWHIPTKAEFQTLSAAVGNNGNTLKAVGQGTGDGTGTNTSGFTALLAGGRSINGGFYGLGGSAYFWSSSEYNSTYAYTLVLNDEDSNILLSNINKVDGFSVRCVKDAGNLSTVNTSAVSNIGATTAIGGGEVTSEGSSSVTERGVCWSTSENPTIANSKTSDGSGLGSFTSSITGLTGNTTYYVRAYATSSVGTGYGNQVSFTTLSPSFTCGTSTVTYEGKTYNTILIGSQCWLKENLDVGTMIQGDHEQTNNSTIEKYCYSDGDANCNTYGGLYQWAEAVQYLNGATNTTSPNPAFSGNVRGICPEGWHIPTQAEFLTLSTAVGDNGNSLKAVGQGTGDGTGTNASGFTALLAGRRSSSSSVYFYGLKSFTYFWSSTEVFSEFAINMELSYNNSNIDLNYNSKDYGFSVRCVKD